MVVHYPEGSGSDAGPVVESDSDEATDDQCALCLQRAFGTIALGEKAPTGTLANALATLQGADKMSSYSARTRATIYRCIAADCSHAVLSFTVASEPIIPDSTSLHIEPLPGTPDCPLPPEKMELPQGP